MINKYNKDENIGELFLKIFRNIILKKEILKHCRLYKDNRKIRFYRKKDFIEYKEKNYITQLEICFEDIPKSNEIPFSVKILMFGSGNQKPFTAIENIPDFIEHVIIGGQYIFSKPISKESFSNHIKRIDFQSFQSLSSHFVPSGTIPSSVIYLKLSNPIWRGLIPNSVKTIEFTNYFNFENIIECKDEFIISKVSKKFGVNQIYSFIPSSVETIIFGESFSHKLGTHFKNSIPSSVKKLIFLNRVYEIDQSILPPTIKSIVLNKKEIDVKKLKNLIKQSK